MGTLLKSPFLQNSQFENLIFHKIHILGILFFTKFTYFKNSRNFWIKIGHLTQCAKVSISTKFTFQNLTFDKIHIFGYKIHIFQKPFLRNFWIKNGYLYQ